MAGMSREKQRLLANGFAQAFRQATGLMVRDVTRVKNRLKALFRSRGMYGMEGGWGSWERASDDWPSC
jgi:hypothetical protein